MKNHISLYIIAAILLLTACNGSGMRTELQNIDEIIETSPDAALTLLNKYGKAIIYENTLKHSPNRGYSVTQPWLSRGIFVALRGHYRCQRIVESRLPW